GGCDDGDDCGIVARTTHTGETRAARSKDEQVCYGRGYAKALDNTAYDRGLADGKLANLNYQAGYHATYPDADTRGHADGLTDGDSAGYQDGYGDGYDDGFSVTYDGCYGGPYSDAYDSAYSNGASDGYSSGYSDGYSSGYSDGSDC